MFIHSTCIIVIDKIRILMKSEPFFYTFSNSKKSKMDTFVNFLKTFRTSFDSVVLSAEKLKKRIFKY
jgi:hypothetical protein